jgi:hypothetical protein
MRFIQNWKILWLLSGFSKKIFEEWPDSKTSVLPIYKKLIARGLKIWVYRFESLHCGDCKLMKYSSSTSHYLFWMVQWWYRWRSFCAVYKIQLKLSGTANHQGMEALVPPEAGIYIVYKHAKTWAKLNQTLYQLVLK